MPITTVAWSLSFVRTATCVGLVLLGGCSLFFPHPDRASNVIGDADTPQDGRCSLAVAQLRKSLPERIIADGIPTPLIIHAPTSTAAARNIISGQSVHFEAPTRDADPPPKNQPALWQIEGLDSAGTVVVDGALLMTGSVVSLRTPQAAGYLQLDQAANSTTRAAASRFILYKADVPDATRPTTCDEQVRDEDFVFVRAVDPNAWVTVNDSGVLSARDPPLAGTRTPSTNSHPRCAREEERCHTDPRGGLLCVWAPVCGD